MKKNLIILTLMSIYVLKLVVTNDIVYYIHPRYIVISILAAMVCLHVAFQTYKKISHLKQDTPQKDLLSTIIVFVLCAALLAPAQGLSHTTAIKRFQKNPKITRAIPNQVSRQKEEGLRNNENTAKSDSQIFSDWIYELSIHNPDLSLYQNREIDITGFVLTDTEDSEKGDLYVARFFMSCCTADATPRGIEVLYSGNDLKNDEWIRIKGKILVVTEEGVQRGVMVPESIEKVPEPEEPYAYF